MDEIEIAMANHIDSLGRKRIIRRLGQPGPDSLTVLIFPLVLSRKERVAVNAAYSREKKGV